MKSSIKLISLLIVLLVTTAKIRATHFLQGEKPVESKSCQGKTFVHFSAKIIS